MTTTLSNPSWILSGVHLVAAGVPSGVTLEQVATVREDHVVMTLPGANALSLGSIVQGDTRRATNGGNHDLSVTFNAGT